MGRNTSTSYSADPFYRTPQARQARPFKVVLACGHTVSAQMRPYSQSMKYICEMNAGCAYQQNWLEYTDKVSGFTCANKLFQNDEPTDTST